MTRKTYTGGKKGRCNVGADKHRLRISIPAKLFGGKRKFIYCGLDDTVKNVPKAQEIADAMNADILAHRFDLSLGRYQRMVSTDEIVSQNHENFAGNIPGVHENKLGVLWRRWVSQLQLSEDTFNNKYRWVERYIHIHDPDWDDTSWTEEITTGAETFNSYVRYVRRCIEWALDEGLVKGRNPYNRISRSSKGVPKARKGFDTAEKIRILSEFKNPTHPVPWQCARTRWYYPMVLFWFLTGLRVGEVAGLKWVDIDWGERRIIIRRSQSRDNSNAGKGHRL
ncbi:MAG: site-specific integrase, partial [Cyanobacteria bacterium P01_F01_bin.153]